MPSRPKRLRHTYTKYNKYTKQINKNTKACLRLHENTGNLKTEEGDSEV